MTESEIQLRPVTKSMEADLLALNNAHAVELSWLEPERLTRLLKEAFHATAVGNVDAFLLAFDQDAVYDSPNFLWFRQRYPHFVYIDRVVVAPALRGRGHARRLYEELFERARDCGYTVVVCEVNLDPPNPASDAFHAGLGFNEVGRAAIHQGTKTVRYLGKAL